MRPVSRPRDRATRPTQPHPARTHRTPTSLIALGRSRAGSSAHCPAPSLCVATRLLCVPSVCERSLPSVQPVRLRTGAVRARPAKRLSPESNPRPSSPQALSLDHSAKSELASLSLSFLPLGARCDGSHACRATRPIPPSPSRAQLAWRARRGPGAARGAWEASVCRPALLRPVAMRAALTPIRLSLARPGTSAPRLGRLRWDGSDAGVRSVSHGLARRACVRLGRSRV